MAGQGQKSEMDRMRAAILAILDTIAECSPAPAGPMYAILNGKGMDYGQFTMLMGTLEGEGLITSNSNTYSITKAGEEMIAHFKQALGL